MMNFFLAIPIEARLAAVFLVGTCLGGLVNWAIYSLAWNARPISPWSRPHPAAPPRCFCTRVPIFGWLGLRRESELYGAGFWIRPMLLEVFFGLGLAWLYWWETEAVGLLGLGVTRPLQAPLPLILHFEFVAHALLATLMLAASMIDTDEKIIPDEITIVGTLVALLAAAAWPWSLLPYVSAIGGQRTLEFMQVASPEAWPAWLDGRPCVGSLAIALGCWLAWCFALLPRVWRGRHGLRLAMKLCLARIAREPSTYRIFRMAVMGGIAIAIVWFRSGNGNGDGWRALLSSLVGMAAGGGLVWAVRIIGSAVLQREAMGFGDVTLMAMIGAFLGWQAAFIIFFLAPFAGLVVAVLRLVLFRDKEIPYGPFLCLAAMFLIVCWHSVWNYAAGAFSLGWFVPAAILCCLALMAGMLGLWRLILRAI
jgi:prepilin signal peptidase PulO-like enzyme (type II secretory pathway)